MTNATLDLADAIEEAFERATGGARQMQSGYDVRTARRSLNLLTMEWANRGINLWTVEQGTIELTAGVGGYQMPANTIDLIEYTLRTNEGEQNQTDTAMQRMSFSSYAAIPNKLARGRPQQILMQRLAPYPVLTIWPLPDRDDYTLVGWRLRRIADSAVGSDLADIPFRFMPALIAGLAFYISQKVPEGESRALLLKQAYDEAFDLATLEDREKATIRLVPRVGRV